MDFFLDICSNPSEHPLHQWIC